MQAKDINANFILAAVAKHQALRAAHCNTPNAWATRWDIAKELPEIPEKVLLAKCKRLIRQGLMEGCCCGCRGNFELTEKGRTRL